MAAHGHPTVAAILVAAGSGQRLGADVPKAFVRVGGRTLLEHAVARFVDHPEVRDVVVVVPGGHTGGYALISAVIGGTTRQESVEAGLAAVAADVELVLVHDVARPFVPADVISAVIATLGAGADAVIPVLPVSDTIRRVDADGTLRGVVDRSTLVAVQTPQGFRVDVLRRAHEQGRDTAVTDDAALVEAVGGQVVAVPGADASFKITTPADLLRAEAVVAHG